MRSWRERAVVVIAASSLAGCGTDSVPREPVIESCDASILTYENFGEPFLLDWCRGCHSAGVPLAMRQDAPPDINFDDLAGVRAFAPEITLRAASAMPTMPPAAGPSDEERALLAEWIACGAP